MSQCMLTATLAVPDRDDFELDFEAGREVLESLTSISDFNFDPEILDFSFYFDAYTEAGEDFDDLDDRLTIMRRTSNAILEELDDLNLGRGENESSEINYIVVAGYKLFVTGGMSAGDAPTEAADVIWEARHLPVAVLQAIGFVTDTSKAARGGDQRALGRTLSDTDAVDAIALGLGTRPEWGGADTLEWIANVIGVRREHPGGKDPVEYLENFLRDEGVNPIESSYLRDYVDDEAAEIFEELQAAMADDSGLEDDEDE